MYLANLYKPSPELREKLHSRVMFIGGKDSHLISIIISIQTELEFTSIYFIAQVWWLGYNLDSSYAFAQYNECFFILLRL
jgi:hypothetical protein